MNLSNHSHILTEEIIDYMFSNSDAEAAISILEVKKKYPTLESLWRKFLPINFSKSLKARKFVLTHMIKSEAHLISKITGFTLNLKINQNNAFQYAFIKPNATLEQ